MSKERELSPDEFSREFPEIPSWVITAMEAQGMVVVKPSATNPEGAPSLFEDASPVTDPLDAYLAEQKRWGTHVPPRSDKYRRETPPELIARPPVVVTYSDDADGMLELAGRGAPRTTARPATSSGDQPPFVVIHLDGAVELSKQEAPRAAESQDPRA